MASQMEVRSWIDTDEKHKRKGLWTSIAIHALLLMLLLLPLFTFPIPPPEQQGILVTFGEADAGGSTAGESAEVKEVSPPPTKAQQSSKPKEAAPIEPKTDGEVLIKSPKRKADPTPDDATKASEVQKVVKSAEELQRERETQEARKRAEEEARQKAEYEKAKAEFEDIWGDGEQASREGQQGDPEGEPDRGVLEGLQTGSGRVGGGLGQRGVLFEPEIRENSQKQGRVVVKVCVDASGQVISAKFTQRGSTTTDAHLVDVAIRNARKYRFTTSDIAEQCGTITIDFKLV